MDPITRRRVQLLLALLLLAAASVLSFTSTEQRVVYVNKTVTVYVNRTVTVPVNRTIYVYEPVDVCLVMDVSGSMEGEKLESAKEAARRFLQETIVPSNGSIRLCLVEFSGEARTLSHLTSNYGAISGAISSLSAGGSTAMGEGIAEAVDILRSEGRPDAKGVIVLMSDGENNAGDISPREAAQMAASSGYRVYTIGFGSDADEDTLREIAGMTGGAYSFASTGAELVAEFSRVAKTITEYVNKTVTELVNRTVVVPENRTESVAVVKHYGSRTLTLLAIPLAFFIPVVEKTLTRTLVRTVLRRPSVEVPRRGRVVEAPRRTASRPPVGPTYGSPTPTLPHPRQQVICPRCGYPNRPGARYCVRCGQRLV